VGPAEIAATLGAALVIGGLIGSVGIGGVLLVPWLTAIIGLSVRDAVAIAMASYIATGIIAVAQASFSEEERPLRAFWPLVLATLPGAFLGGVGIAAIPDAIARLCLALFLMLTGAWTLLRDRLSAAGPSMAAKPGWPTGALAGFASALTGTGGPAALIPILIWRRVPVLAAILLGQVVQLPIALAATAGNLTSGPIDWPAAALVAAALSPGVLAGRWAATRLPVAVLTPILALLLVAAGILLAVRALP
jgi:uncharacterized membrane protein YfcA